MTERQKILEMALQTLWNYLDGDEQTREDDARFALHVIEHYIREAQTTGSERDS